MKTKPKIKCNCQICNKEFFKNESVIKMGWAKYCSKKCSYKSKETLNKYRNKICVICGKNFISNQKFKKQVLSHKYCSKECSSIGRSQQKKTGINKTCIQCGKQFYTKIHNKKTHNFCGQKCHYIYKIGKPNPKASKTLARKIASGEINPKRNFYKQGWYKTKTGNKEWFGSSYEEKRMKQLDEMKVRWTKNHGIRIPYTDNDGRKRNYVPDFLVNDKIIEEVKPKNLVNSKMDNNLLKHQSAIKFCNKNGYQFRIITEKELDV